MRVSDDEVGDSFEIVLVHFQDRFQDGRGLFESFVSHLEIGILSQDGAPLLFVLVLLSNGSFSTF